MPERSFEIRVCKSCGLRYPLVMGSAPGIRCPICMGETRVAHRGGLVFERRLSVPLDRAAARANGSKCNAVLLDNIRSAWNVGSMLRSAEGFGFAHAYLCGITPTPENDAVRKTALGAEDSLPWSYHKDAVKLVKGLKAKGWTIYGLEENKYARPLHEAALTNRDIALIVGSEITGVDPGLLSLCDAVFYIPMRGEKKSFNAAVAFGVAAYALSASD
ncbi:MAG: RNA methyltransferase [Anaerolineales bacterium]|nr:RNA methyltransferase [Anaerolineales bacterium]